MDPRGDERIVRPYTYAVNNPVSLLDPQGTEVQIPNTKYGTWGDFADSVKENLQRLVKDKAVVDWDPIGGNKGYRLKLTKVNRKGSKGSITALDLLEFLINHQRVVKIYEDKSVEASHTTIAEDAIMRLPKGKTGASVITDLTPGPGLKEVDVWWGRFNENDPVKGRRLYLTGFEPRRMAWTFMPGEIALAHELIHASLAFEGKVFMGAWAVDTPMPGRMEGYEGQAMANTFASMEIPRANKIGTYRLVSFEKEKYEAGGKPWSENKIRLELNYVTREIYSGVWEKELREDKFPYYDPKRVMERGNE